MNETLKPDDGVITRRIPLTTIRECRPCQARLLSADTDGPDLLAWIRAFEWGHPEFHRDPSPTGDENE